MISMIILPWNEDAGPDVFGNKLNSRGAFCPWETMLEN